MNLTPRKKLFVDAATEMFGAGAIVSKTMMKEAADKCNVPLPYWMQKSCKVGYNQFKLPNEVLSCFIIPEAFTVNDEF